MAAGASRRYGENKLLVPLAGRTLIRRALDAVPTEELLQTVVVASHPEILALAGDYGFLPCRNQAPCRGVSHTIRLGLDALGDCDGVLFLVCDQPLLRRESTQALCRMWRRQPERIAALSCGGKRGNPCLFPARLIPQLQALEGDRGGSTVIQRHSEDLVLLEVPASELMDVDTPQALAQLEKLLACNQET